MTNYTTVKGAGDFDESCHVEPSEQQVLNALRNNPVKVWRNIVSNGYSEAMEEAMAEYIKYELREKLDVVLYESAKELLESGEIL